MTMVRLIATLGLLNAAMNKILQIMWEPQEMRFQPVDPNFSATLTVDCDDSSPGAGALKPGQRFYVLDLRAAKDESMAKHERTQGLVIRVRTRFGWFTWGKLKDINEQTNGGVNQNFKCVQMRCPIRVRAKYGGDLV
jgi:hypothetical protein